jgi:hypothetical protein
MVNISLTTVQRFCLKIDDTAHQFPKGDLCICVLFTNCRQQHSLSGKTYTFPSCKFSKTDARLCSMYVFELLSKKRGPITVVALTAHHTLPRMSCNHTLCFIQLLFADLRSIEVSIYMTI